MDKTKMIGLGMYGIDGLEDMIDTEAFSSEISLLDYSCVLIEIENVIYEYMNTPGKFQGLHCLNDDNKSARLVSDMNRRKNEIVELLSQGNNIFVTLPGEQHLYVRTGKKEYSGSGANRAVSNIVNLFDLLSFLPVEIETVKAMGQNIRYVGDERFRILKEELLDDFRYCSYLSKGEGKPLLQIANTTKTVGMVMEYSHGKIILLPEFADGELYRNDKEWEAAVRKCIGGLKRLDAELKENTDAVELPKWAAGFLLPAEKEELKKLDVYREQLDEIKNKIHSQETAVKELQKWKLTFTSTGKNLENICKEIFLELGFTDLPTESNRSDLVLQYGNRDIVVEIKGLSKSAGEKNAAQLEKWVSEHIEKYGREPKAILLVNAFKNNRLDERTEEVFPRQMLKYATNREQCLLSTTQLLCLYLDCRKNPDKKEEVINKLLHTAGVYSEYRNYQDYIEKI